MNDLDNKLLKHIIDQKTFDDAVEENVEIFDMSSKEAIQSTIDQFHSQNVDLSNIITDAHLYNGLENHPFVIKFNQFKTIIEDTFQSEEKVLTDEIVRSIIILIKDLIKNTEECQAKKLFIGNNGGYQMGMDVLHMLYEQIYDSQLNSNNLSIENRLNLNNLLISILLYLKSIVNGYPDLLNGKHIYLFLNILKQEILNDDDKKSINQLNELIMNDINLLDDKENIIADTNESGNQSDENEINGKETKSRINENETTVITNEIINHTLDFISFTIILHENNRELWMTNNLLTILYDIFNRKPTNTIIMKILKIFRFMCLDDDIRVQISNTHERIRKISDVFLPLLTLKIGESFKNEISNTNVRANRENSGNSKIDEIKEINENGNIKTSENKFEENIDITRETSESVNSIKSGVNIIKINKTEESNDTINNDAFGKTVENSNQITCGNSFNKINDSGSTDMEDKIILQFKIQLIKTISYLCVRNEHCMIIYENKGVESVRNILNKIDLTKNEHFSEYHIDLFITSMIFLKTIAGNDDVKNLIHESGIIENIVKIMIHDKLKNNLKLNETFLLLLSTLTLRHDNIVNQLVEWDIFEIIIPIMKLYKNNTKIIKYGCWTIRNICSRNRSSIDLLFHVEGVQLMEECLDVHTSIQYDIKNTMKELGDSVHVKFDEQWKGKGQCNIRHEF